MEVECGAHRKRVEQLESELHDAAHEKHELLAELHKLRSVLKHVERVAEEQIHIVQDEKGGRSSSAASEDVTAGQPAGSDAISAGSSSASHAASHEITAQQPQQAGIRDVLASMEEGEGLPLRRRPAPGAEGAVPLAQDTAITAAPVAEASCAAPGSADLSTAGSTTPAMHTICRGLLHDILGPCASGADPAGASPAPTMRAQQENTSSPGEDALPTPLFQPTREPAPRAPLRNPAGLVLPGAPPAITPTISNRLPAAMCMNQSFSFSPVSPTQQHPTGMATPFSPTQLMSSIGCAVPSHPIAYEEMEASFGSNGSDGYAEGSTSDTPERHLSFVLHDTVLSAGGAAEQLGTPAAHGPTAGTPSGTASTGPSTPAAVVATPPAAVAASPHVAMHATPAAMFLVTPGGPAAGAGGVTPLPGAGGPGGEQSDAGSPVIEGSPYSDAPSPGAPSSAGGSPAV